MIHNESMRVAHILRKYDPREWAGTETAVRVLAQGLRDRRIDSVIYAPKLEKDIPPDQDLLRRDGFEVHRFRAILPILGASRVDRDKLIAVGGNLVSFDAPLQLLEEPKLDVIHTHALNRLGGLARLVARARRLPFVVTIHGGYLDLPEAVAAHLSMPARRGFDYGKLFGLLLRSRKVVESADAVITVNSREADLLRKQFPKLRVLVIPHGVASSRYQVDCRNQAEAFLPAIQGKTVLLCVARIDAAKNQQFLVDCMPQIKRNFPNSVLVLVGPTTDSTYEHRLRTQIKNLGLQDAVHLPGFLAPDDPRLVGLYQCAHVFVLPSTNEPFGLVLLESWAAGCPVIASNTSGPRQLVRNGENGFLFQTNDAASFLHTLDEMFQSEPRRRMLGATGQRMVNADFDTQKLAGRVGDLYAELCAKSKTQS